MYKIRDTQGLTNLVPFPSWLRTNPKKPGGGEAFFLAGILAWELLDEMGLSDSEYRRFLLFGLSQNFP